MMVEIRIAQDADKKEWDRIISESPHGTIFHEWKWLEIIQKHTHMQFYPLIAIQNNIPIGIIPLFYQKIGIIKMVFSPPPGTSLFFLGPILINFENQKQHQQEQKYCEFQKAIDDFIHMMFNPDYTSISLPPNLNDPRPFGWSGYSVEPHYDYIIDLIQGPDQLYSTLSNKKRQDFNRAKRRGMLVEIGGRKEYNMVLNLMDARYKQQSKPITVHKNYLMDIYDAFSDRMIIVVTKYKDEVVTGSIDLLYRDTIFSWIGNPKPITNISPSANDLVIWESIRYGCEQGFQNYVTLSAAGNRRLHSYYSSKFNPKLQVRFSVKKHSFLTGILEKGYMKFFKPLVGESQQLLINNYGKK